MSQVIICSTCREAATSDVEFYALDSDPTASNDINLREKLLYCVPEFEEILNDGVENTWICGACCQTLCWSYSFRKMCLETKSKLEMAIINDNGFCVKEEEEIDDITDADYITVKSEPDAIKTEVCSDEDSSYTLVETEETDPLEIEPEDFSLIQHACNTIPALREKHITPKSFKCHVEIEPLNKNQIKHMTKRRNRRRYKRPLHNRLKRETKNLTAFVCWICNRRFRTYFFLSNHLKTHNQKKSVVAKQQNCEKKATPILSTNQENNSQQIESGYVDFLTSKFQNLIIRRRFVKPRRSQETVPKLLQLLLPSMQRKKKQKNGKTGALRKAVFNLEQNEDTAMTDFCEANPHEQFGISAKPSYPTSETTSADTEVCFVPEDALERNMTDHILSVLRETNPNATMSQPPITQHIDPNKIKHRHNVTRRQNEPQKPKQKKAKPPDTTDHTYSLSSKKFSERCLECGCTFDMVELYDYHVDSYHAAWFLNKEAKTKVKSMVLEDLNHKNLNSQMDSGLSDLDEELERNEKQRKKQRKVSRKRSKKGKSKNKKSDSETDTADEGEDLRGGEVFSDRKKAKRPESVRRKFVEVNKNHSTHFDCEARRQTLLSSDEQQKSVIVYNSRTEDSYLGKTMANEKVEGLPENCARQNVQQSVLHHPGNFDEKPEVIVHEVQIFKKGKPITDHETLMETSHHGQAEAQCPKRPIKEFQFERKLVRTSDSQKTFSMSKSETVHGNLSLALVDEQKQVPCPKQRVEGTTPESVIKYQPGTPTSVLQEEISEGNLNITPLTEDIQQALDPLRLVLSPSEDHETAPMSIARVHENIQQIQIQRPKDYTIEDATRDPENVLKVGHIDGDETPPKTVMLESKDCVEEPFLVLTAEGASIIHEVSQSNTVQKNIRVEQVLHSEYCEEEPVNHQKPISVENNQQESNPLVQEFPLEDSEVQNDSSVLRELLGRPQQMLPSPPLQFLTSPAPQQITQQPLYFLVNPSATNEVPLLITANNTFAPQFITIPPETTPRRKKKKSKSDRTKNIYILPSPDNTIANTNIIFVPEVQPSTSKGQQTVDTSGLSAMLPLENQPNLLSKSSYMDKKKSSKHTNGRSVMKPLDSVGDQNEKNMVVEDSRKVVAQAYSELTDQFLERANLFIANKENESATASYEICDFKENSGTLVETQSEDSLKRRADDDGRRNTFKKLKTCEELSDLTNDLDENKTSLEHEDYVTGSKDNFELNEVLFKCGVDKSLSERQKKKGEENEELGKVTCAEAKDRSSTRKETKVMQEEEATEEGDSREARMEDELRSEDIPLELRQLGDNTILDISLLENEENTMCQTSCEQTKKESQTTKKHQHKRRKSEMQGEKNDLIEEDSVLTKKMEEVKTDEIESEQRRLVGESTGTATKETYIESEETLCTVTNPIVAEDDLFVSDFKKSVQSIIPSSDIQDKVINPKFLTITCAACSSTFNEEYYDKHLCAGTPLKDSEEAKATHQCGVCSKTFNEKYALNLHYVEHRYEKPVEEVVREMQEQINETVEKMNRLRKFQCEKCEMSFDSNEVLRMHCAYKHGS